MSMRNLGKRLREERKRAGFSLRAVARELGVSPSFVSQIETGKSRPSVATLYAIAQLLQISVDELFSMQSDTPRTEAVAHRPARASEALSGGAPDGEPEPFFDASATETGSRLVNVLQPGERLRLELETGVVWERLTTSSGPRFEFMLITYPPHSSSRSDGRMLRHNGHEYGYLIEGELEIAVGFDTYKLRSGDSIELDSSLPHLLTNHGEVEARGAWLVAHAL